jgi:hypothetical protein
VEKLTPIRGGEVIMRTFEPSELAHSMDVYTTSFVPSEQSMSLEMQRRFV